MKLKSICNFIDYLNLKNNNKKDKDEIRMKYEEEINCSGWYEFLKGLMLNSRWEREKWRKKICCWPKPDAF